MEPSKTVIVLQGPTGVGKTELSLALAETLHYPILNADSRQIYRDIPIGTAAPTNEERERVPHYFVGTHALDETYNAGQFERDALNVLSHLDGAILSGGSMMYIDAVVHGLDDIPEVDPAIRAQVRKSYEEGGLSRLQEQVQQLDPDYWALVDRANPQRLMHCVEVSLSSHQPYSSFRRRQTTPRPSLKFIRIGLQREREELYDRINHRVEKMMDMGLLEEVQRVLPYRHMNSLNTVGYKELFQYLDGQLSLDEAIDLIKQNTRHYAKRQMTWLRRDEDINWIDATLNYEQQIHYITDLLHHPDRM